MKAGLVKLHLFLSVSRLSRKGAASSPTPGLACTPEGSHWGNAPSSRPAAKLAEGAVKPDTPRHSPRSQASAMQDKEARTGASLCRTETNRENSDVFHRDKPSSPCRPGFFLLCLLPRYPGLEDPTPTPNVPLRGVPRSSSEGAAGSPGRGAAPAPCEGLAGLCVPRGVGFAELPLGAA